MEERALETTRIRPRPGMLDAEQRVAGTVEYVCNVEVPGMLHAAVARSSRAHARIVSIDVSAAAAMPGVRIVLTGEDIRAMDGVEERFGPVFRDQPVLALDKVRFIGEPVAAVAADDAHIAADAAHSIQIEYEEMPAVFDAAEALEPGAPRVHDGGVDLGPTFSDVVVNQDGGNVCNHFKIRKGDVDAAFAQAEHVFEHRFTTPAAQHVPFETHVCVAAVEGDGVTLWASTQTPHVVARQVAELLGRPASNVRVVVSSLGGGYGAKCYPKTEPLTAVLALAAGRPVRLSLTREEEFVTVTKHASDITLTTAVDADGRILARRATCLFNTGAYADIGPRLIRNAGFCSPGPYAIPNVWVDSYAAYTNLPPAGAFRGYGQPQTAWAYEQQMDMIAEEMGIDALDFRRRNLITAEDDYHTGERITDNHFAQMLDRSIDGIRWHEPPEPPSAPHKVRAKGFAVIIKGTVTPSTSTATVHLNDDGSANVLTSSVEMGQGARTALAVLAAERLALPLDCVRVSTVDTAFTPYDQQTSSSRTTFSMGNAVVRACDDIVSQLREHGAHVLGVDPATIRMSDARVRSDEHPEGGLLYRDVLHRIAAGNLVGHGRFQTQGGLHPETGQGIATAHWHQSACAVEVEVDVETGVVDVLDIHTTTWAGRVVNPDQADLQGHGNIVFGLSQALFEEMVFEDGQLRNANLGDYMITSFEDLPARLVADTMESDDPDAEIYGIGENTLAAVAPAIGNAVARATGRRITDLPITPERVLRALRAPVAAGQR
jgi:CO/xanthine dehydrogenase Mo-binding subunit